MHTHISTHAASSVLIEDRVLTNAQYPGGLPVRRITVVLKDDQIEIDVYPLAGSELDQDIRIAVDLQAIYAEQDSEQVAA